MIIKRHIGMSSHGAEPKVDHYSACRKIQEDKASFDPVFQNALAIGVSATRKKMRTMTRSLVVLSVIFILTKCL